MIVLHPEALLKRHSFSRTNCSLPRETMAQHIVTLALFCAFAIYSASSQATECERERGQHCHKWAQCERRQGDPKPRCYCSPGYQGDGQNCHQNEHTRTDCHQPSNIQRGSFNPRRGSYTIGTVITYQCDSGYNHLGNAQRTCEQGGRWSGSDPRCDSPNECQKRNHQTCHLHAECVRLRNEKYECKCRDGYKGDGVYCEAKGCERPPDITNGRLLTNQQNFVRGNVISYKCDRGYKLQGNEQRSCRNDGRWSGNEPRCEPFQQKPPKKSCPHPQGIKNGETKVSDGSYRPGSKVTYSCRRPYRLSGNTERTCQDDGLWSGTEPLCQRARQKWRRCQSPQEVVHGYIRTSDSAYKPRTVVTYECRQPYRIVGGSSQRRCLANGQWTGSAPRCEDTDQQVERKCQRPPENIAHGQIKISNQQLTVGTVVTFTCNRGWRLEGNSQRTCQNDGTWSGNQPRCQHK